MYTVSMRTEQRIIKNTHIQSKTNDPLYTEAYTITNKGHDGFHCHEFFEIGITLEGEVLHHTKDSSQLLHRGHLYLIPIGQSHSVEVPLFWRVQNIYFLPRLIFQNLNTANFTNPLIHHFLLKLVQKDFDAIVHLNLSEDAVIDIEQLIAVQQKISLSNKQLLDNYRSNCLLNILMIICETYFEKYPYDSSKTDARIPKILSIIHASVGVPTGDIIHKISAELSLNPQHINKLVQKAFSTSLSNLIIETKIEKSCELLMDNYLITEIAQMMAFYDHSHYIKYFVKYFGITPSQYRDKHASTIGT